MNFNNLTDKEIISYHLHLLHQYDENVTVFSSLTAALRDARLNTGRDLETGETKRSEDESKMGNWSGAICYLIILDQLGKCYKPKGDPAYSNLNSVQRCLKYYTKFTDNEIDAVYALRNAFAHDYSISNVNASKPSLQHHFTLLGFRMPDVLKLPKTNWDGSPTGKTNSNMTYISLPSLGDVVEAIWKLVLEFHNDNNLEVILSGGTTEIRTRYLQFIHSDKNDC